MNILAATPGTRAELEAWDALVGELPKGVRLKAVRWRDGSYQVHADLPRRWHRPGSRIDRMAYGTGPALLDAIGACRSHLHRIEADLHMPGQALDPDALR